MDLDSVIWIGSYLPPNRSKTKGKHVQGVVKFENIQIKLIVSNAILLGCLEVETFLVFKKKSKAIYSLLFYDNICLFRCIFTHKLIEKNIIPNIKIITKQALFLARYFYDKPKMKRLEVPKNNFFDLPEIEKKFKIKINLYELESEKK